jgi:hypothetical protein
LGRYVLKTFEDEKALAFVPPALPPDPPVRLDGLQVLLEQANQAIGRLDDPTVFTQLPTEAQLLNGPFNQLQAYWIDATTVAIQPQFMQSSFTYTLQSSLSAKLGIRRQD